MGLQKTKIKLHFDQLQCMILATLEAVDTSFRTSLGEQMVDFEAVNLGKMLSPQPGDKPVVPPTLRRPVPLD